MQEIKKPKKPLIFYYVIVMLILLLFNFLAIPWLAQRQVQEVDYGTFMTMTKEKNIGQVEVQEQENQIIFTDKDKQHIYKTGMMPDPDLTDRLYDSGAVFTSEIIKNAGGPNAMTFGMGKSNAKVYVKSSEGIRFSDVAGEAGVPFFSMSGSEFVEMFVGMGVSKVRDLFKQAKEKAPCIVFIDEIDAIGQKRDGRAGGNDEREQALNQLLTEMDGFEENTGVMILAATNRPESLDPALTRPGRFDRRVPVELPNLQGREAILRVHAKKVNLSDNIDFKKIARMASGASGAELANIVNETALRAVRDNREYVTQADLEESIEVVIAGYQKKISILTDQEKKVVAYHEIGHALVAAKQTNSAPVQKITIVPRTSGALGYTMQVEEGNHYLMRPVRPSPRLKSTNRW